MGALTNKIAIVFNALIAGGVAAGVSLLLKLSDSGVWAIWISLFTLFSLIQTFVYFRSGMGTISTRLAANSKANRAVSDELKGVQNAVTGLSDKFETATTGLAVVGSNQSDANEAETSIFNHSFPFDRAEQGHDEFEDLTEEVVDLDASPVEPESPVEDFGSDPKPIDEIHAEEADLHAVVANKASSFNLTDHFQVSEEGRSDTSSSMFGGGMAAAGSVALARSIEIEPDIDQLPDPELTEWARPIVTDTQPIGQIREGVNAIGEVSGDEDDEFDFSMPDPSDAEEKTPLLASVLRNKVEELQAARQESEAGFSEVSDINSVQAFERSDTADDFVQNAEMDQPVEQFSPEFFDVSGTPPDFSTSEPENEFGPDFGALQSFDPTREPGEFDAAEPADAEIDATDDPLIESVEQDIEAAIDPAPLALNSGAFDTTEPSSETSAFQTIDVGMPTQSGDRRTSPREMLLSEVPALKDAFDQMALEEMTLSSGRAISGNIGPGRSGIAGFTTSFEGELPPMGEADLAEIEVAEIEVAEIEVDEIEVDEIEVDEIEIVEPDPTPVREPVTNVAMAEQFQDGSSTGAEETIVMNKIAAAINRQANSGSGILQNGSTASAGGDFLDITSEIGGMSIPDQRPTASAVAMDTTDDNLLMDLEDLLGAPTEIAEPSIESLETIGGGIDQADAGSEGNQLHAVSDRTVDNIGGLATAAILAAIPEPEVDMSACQVWTNDCGDPDAFVEQPELEGSEARGLETLTVPVADQFAPLTDDATDLMDELGSLADEPDPAFEKAEPETAEVLQMVFEENAVQIAEEIEPEMGEIAPLEFTADAAIIDTEPAVVEADPVMEAAEPEMVEAAPFEVATDTVIEEFEPAAADVAPVVEAAEPEMVEAAPLDMATVPAIEEFEPAATEAAPVVEVAEPELVEAAPLEVATDTVIEEFEPAVADVAPVVEAAEPEMVEAAPLDMAAVPAIEEFEPAVADAAPVVEAAEPEMVEAAPLEVAPDPVIEEFKPVAVETAPVAETAEPEMVEAAPLDMAAVPAIEEIEPAVVEADPAVVAAEPEVVEAAPTEAGVKVAAEVPAAPASIAEKSLIAQPGAAVPAAEKVIDAGDSEAALKTNSADRQKSEDIAAKRLQVASEALAPSRVKTGAKPVFEIRPDVMDTIRYALEYDTIDLFMQPIVDMKSKKVRFFEVLSRVRGPDDEYIKPDRYMQPATESGAISVIDFKMLKRAIQVLRKMSNTGREIGLFVNLSLHTLQDEKSFNDFIQLMREQTDLAGEIIFDLAQPVTKQLRADEWDRLREISSLGFVFAMDNVTDWVIDFGLMSARGFRYIKVDGATMKRGMADNGAMVRAEDLQALLTRKGVTIIGEKLETKDDLILYRQCYIEYVQGFLVGKPKLFEVDND